MTLRSPITLPLRVVADLREMRLLIGGIVLVALILALFVGVDQHHPGIVGQEVTKLLGGLSYRWLSNGRHSDLLFTCDGFNFSFSTAVIFATLVWLTMLALRAPRPMSIRVDENAVTTTPLSVFGFTIGASLVREMGEFASVGLTSEMYRGGYVYSLVLWGKDTKPNVLLDERLIGKDGKAVAEIKDQAQQLSALLKLPLITPEAEGIYDA